jgi:hypothetical protein
LPAAWIRPGVARTASSRAPQIARDETRFMIEPPSRERLEFPDFT